MGPRAGLDRYGKSRPHRDSIPGPSTPYPFAIPTELPGPLREKQQTQESEKKRRREVEWGEGEKSKSIVLCL
jgi:hypothetical protein